MKTQVAEQLFKEGKAKERLFAILTGGKVGSTLEDLRGRDVKMTLSFDIKGMKKLNRGDTEPSRVYHWVELAKGNKKPGWVFNTTGADFLAFETELTFLIVARERLADHIKARIDRKEKTHVPTPYKLYYRPNIEIGGEDILTLVPVAELRRMAATEILKNEG